MILLEGGIPALSWIGIGLTIALGLLGFLLRDAYQNLKRRQDQAEEGLSDLTEKLDAEKLNNERSMRSLDSRINDLHINILNRLDDIKDKFNEFRK